MQKLAIAALITGLTCLASSPALAKGRTHFSSSHGSAPHAAPHESGGSHITVRPNLSSSRDSGSGTTANGTASTNAAAAEPAAGGIEDEHNKRIREARAEAKAKADAEFAAERKAKELEAEEKRKIAAQEAAAAAAEAEKRAAAEERMRKQEEARLEAKKRKAEWEGRCQIQGVMSYADLAVCKEVLRSYLRT